MISMPLASKIKNCYRWILWLLIVVMMVVLLLTNSRAAWIGCLAGTGYVFCKMAKPGKYFRAPLILFVPLLLAVTFLLMQYKSDSTRGRKLIYQLSWQILKENWPSGAGFKKFRACFNEKQAAYFSTHDINSKTALLADNTFYAFNDYLQWAAETGVAGIILLLLALTFIGMRMRLLNRRAPGSPIITAASASLICIGVAALFSYPLQVIPIQALVLASIAILLFYPVEWHGKFIRTSTTVVRCFYVIFCMYFIADSVIVYQRKAASEDAFELALTGQRKKAIWKYEQIINRYPGQGDILLAYAEQLYYSNRLQDALRVLEKARFFYTDNSLYLLKARIENEEGRFREAEKSSLHAVYMVPNRMASRFNVMNFYFSQHDTLNTLNWANSIINMPVKVPSGRTAFMLQQVEGLIGRINKK